MKVNFVSFLCFSLIAALLARNVDFEDTRSIHEVGESSFWMEFPLPFMPEMNITNGSWARIPISEEEFHYLTSLGMQQEASGE